MSHHIKQIKLFYTIGHVLQNRITTNIWNKINNSIQLDWFQKMIIKHLIIIINFKVFKLVIFKLNKLNNLKTIFEDK